MAQYDSVQYGDDAQDNLDKPLSLEGGDDLKEIVEVLDDDVMSKWKDIAVQLKISENSKRIELENPQSIRQQGVEMFKTWMKNAEPEECTRRTLLQALSSRTVGAKQLAKKLRRKWSSDSTGSDQVNIMREIRKRDHGYEETQELTTSNMDERRGEDYDHEPRQEEWNIPTSASMIMKSLQKLLRRYGRNRRSYGTPIINPPQLGILSYANVLLRKLYRNAIIILLIFLAVTVGVIIYFKPSQQVENQNTNRSTVAGREREANDIQTYLKMNGSAVVTIVGPPGVGKSALATYIGNDFKKYGWGVYPVDMKTIDNIAKLKKEILKLAEIDDMGNEISDVEHWANSLTRDTLLILDNCDHHVYDAKKSDNLCELLTAIQRNNLKTILTYQAIKHLKLRATVHRVTINYLDYNTTNKILMEELKNFATPSDISQLCSVIEGMPLAVMNIKALLTSSNDMTKTCDINCIISRLKDNPIELFSKHELHTSATVTASIDIAYNQLSSAHKKCGGILATLDGEFDKEKAANALKHAKVDSTRDCINELFVSHLLEHSPIETSYPICHIHGASYTLECMHTKSSSKEYRFHRLIKEYLVHKHHRSEDAAANKSTNWKEVTKAQKWEYLIKTATKKSYCPSHYMSLVCQKPWQTLLETLTEKMNSSVVEKDVIDVGIMGTYWGRTVLKDLLVTPHALKYAEKSLHILEKQTDYKLKAKWLAAYVFYNHYSLRIKWQQIGCTCPNPRNATHAMIRRRHKIDKIYSELKGDHLAWAARKSFYIDFFCCCTMSAEVACEHPWKFWLWGIVSQIATTNIYFENEKKCAARGLPRKSPHVVQGFWHYSFTQNYTEAKRQLVLGLNQSKNRPCPVKDIASVMALHAIHTAMQAEDLTTTFVDNYLKSRTLIDYHIKNYKTFYEQVVIPFLHELGNGLMAKEIEDQLKLSQPELQQGTAHYECELFYWHHSTSYTDFLCLTL